MPARRAWPSSVKFLALLVACIPAALAASEQHGTTIELDLSFTKPTAPLLFGIFFEEINHAGVGGLYAELINDRSFEGFAHASGFLNDTSKESNTPDLEYTVPADAWDKFAPQIFWGTEPDQLFVQPLSWKADNGTDLVLSKLSPLAPKNPVNLKLSGVNGSATVANYGYWGLPLEEEYGYALSIYLNALTEGPSEVTVALQSSDGTQTYGSLLISNVTAGWAQYTGILVSNATTNDARLAITVAQDQSVLVDVVSLFPEANGYQGSTSVWRLDLIQHLQALKPKFIRLPGGCFIEGSDLSSGWYWNATVGPIDSRRGQWTYWRYWIDNGLGLFEYMQLAEILGAEPVYVFNAGSPVVGDRKTPAEEFPMVQDTLNSLEFVLGQNGKFADLRRSMGRVEPWPLKFLGIGNENCGDGYFDDHVRPNPYQDNFLMFYSAIKALYPWMTLISNCDLRPVNMPQDIHERHFYFGGPGKDDPVPGAEKAWGMRSAFDDYTPEKDGQIFISEYATIDMRNKEVTTLQGALGEAAVMSSMETHSDVIRMAAYAPLISHEKNTWGPAQLAVFNINDTFLTPSYHVQQLFSESYGPLLVNTNISTVDNAPVNLSASTTCSDLLCSLVSTKIVNFQPVEQNVTLSLSGVSKALFPTAIQTTLAAPDGDFLATNSFTERTKVAPVKKSIDAFTETSVILPPWSFSVFTFGFGPLGAKSLLPATSPVAIQSISIQSSHVIVDSSHP